MIAIGKPVVIKSVDYFEKIVILSGVIKSYDGLTGIYTIEDQNGAIQQRAVDKIWIDFEKAQKNLYSGNFLIN